MKRKSNSMILCLLLCLALFAGALSPAALAEEEPGWQYSETVGSFGRFVIEGLDFAVPLYRSDPEAGDAQTLCDAWDSAVYDRPEFGDLPVVADHVNQGFTVIKHCVPEETVCRIETEYGREEFLCAGIDYNCRNTGTKLLDSAGYSITAGFGPGWLVTYTCNEDWEHVTVVLWRKTGGVDPDLAALIGETLRLLRPVRPAPY